jgi:hypothetical protein
MGVSKTSFTSGSPGGPGRPKKTDEERSVLEMVRAGITEQDVIDILKQQVSKAKHGDTRAATLVLSYRVGNPSQDLNVNVKGELLIWDLPEAQSKPQS